MYNPVSLLKLGAEWAKEFFSHHSSYCTVKYYHHLKTDFLLKFWSNFRLFHLMLDVQIQTLPQMRLIARNMTIPLILNLWSLAVQLNCCSSCQLFSEEYFAYAEFELSRNRAAPLILVPHFRHIDLSSWPGSFTTWLLSLCSSHLSSSSSPQSTKMTPSTWTEAATSSSQSRWASARWPNRLTVWRGKNYCHWATFRPSFK